MTVRQSADDIEMIIRMKIISKYRLLTIYLCLSAKAKYSHTIVLNESRKLRNLHKSSNLGFTL